MNWQWMNAAFEQRFGVAIMQTYGMFSMNMVTSRVDEQDFTPEQVQWINGYETAVAHTGGA